MKYMAGLVFTLLLVTNSVLGGDVAKTAKENPPPGYRLTSVPIPLGSGKNPALQPRTRVDVYAILKIAQESDAHKSVPETAVARLAENAIVVSTDPVQPDSSNITIIGQPPKESWVSLWVPVEDVENLLLARELAPSMGTQFCCTINPNSEGGEKSTSSRLVTASDFLNKLRTGMKPATALPPATAEQVVTAAHSAPLTPAIPAAPATHTAPATTVSTTPPAASVVSQIPSENTPPAKAPPVLRLPERLPDGVIRIDGSSTVFPIVRALKAEFARVYPNVRIDLKGEAKGESPAGTSGGFKKFLVGEIDISDASRFIKDAEVEKAAKAGMEFFEIPIAWDALTVAVSKQNDWVTHLSVQELKEIWKPGSLIKNWKDVRPGFPTRLLSLAGPGSDSGTFDYFTEVIVGEARQSRADYMASEDDEIVAKTLLRDPNALGYFGMAYFDEHKEKLRALAIDGGSGPVMPTPEAVTNGSYTPLSRPLFIYVSASAAKRAEVDGFIRYFLTQAGPLAKKAGYIPLPDEMYAIAAKRYLQGSRGTMQIKGQAANLQALISNHK